MYEFILVSREENVGVITFNRPERFNAWHSPMRHEIVRALQEMQADDSIRAVILTGAGDAFSPGQDSPSLSTSWSRCRSLDG